MYVLIISLRGIWWWWINSFYFTNQIKKKWKEDRSLYSSNQTHPYCESLCGLCYREGVVGHVRLPATVHATASLPYYYSYGRGNSCPLPPAMATSTDASWWRSPSLSHHMKQTAVASPSWRRHCVELLQVWKRWPRSTPSLRSRCCPFLSRRSWIDMYILCVEEYIGEFIGETVAGTVNLG